MVSVFSTGTKIIRFGHQRRTLTPRFPAAGPPMIPGLGYPLPRTLPATPYIENVSLLHAKNQLGHFIDKQMALPICGGVVGSTHSAYKMRPVASSEATHHTPDD